MTDERQAGEALGEEVPEAGTAGDAGPEGDGPPVHDEARQPDDETAAGAASDGEPLDSGAPAAPAPDSSPAAVDEAGPDLDRRLARLTRRGFLGLAAGAGAAYAGWSWLFSRELDGRIPWPLRRALEGNRALWEAVYDPTRLAPTYAVSRAARRPRVNGLQGLDRRADPAAWRLAVGGLAGPAQLELTLGDIQALPHVDLVTELRCIEGWSMIVHWTGARLADFVAAFPPATRDGSAPDPLRRPGSLPRYLALATPGGGYYVGLDLATALHPQTLLAWAINGRPLPWNHGAPLRLVAPIKYGIKSIKRIGSIVYTDRRPRDYWAERGYDWHAGH